LLLAIIEGASLTAIRTAAAPAPARDLPGRTQFSRTLQFWGPTNRPGDTSRPSYPSGRSAMKIEIFVRAKAPIQKLYAEPISQERPGETAPSIQMAHFKLHKKTICLKKYF
jgi:hypothetical protein